MSGEGVQEFRSAASLTAVIPVWPVAGHRFADARHEGSRSSNQAFERSRQPRKISKAAGIIETTMMASITAEKFFCTKGMFPKK
jgi:hypothetical protein